MQFISHEIYLIRVRACNIMSTTVDLQDTVWFQSYFLLLDDDDVVAAAHGSTL